VDEYWRRLMASRNEAIVVGWKDIRSHQIRKRCFVS
jgi:hypothetical protein